MKNKFVIIICTILRNIVMFIGLFACGVFLILATVFDLLNVAFEGTIIGEFFNEVANCCINIMHSVFDNLKSFVGLN